MHIDLLVISLPKITSMPQLQQEIYLVFIFQKKRRPVVLSLEVEGGLQRWLL